MIRIGNRAIGKANPCFIIAEIGTSHGGSIERARDLIRAARDAAAEDSGLVFLCTPFGLRSARILKSIGVQAIKIASPESNHYPLLQEVAGYKLPVIASTGVTTAGDIERMLSILGKNTVLLHCITSYPAPEEEYNIRILPNLSHIFGVATGVSDHSLDPHLVPMLSIIAGGCVIEKHLTLERNGTGLDDPIALDPTQFRSMVEKVRFAENDKREHVLEWINETYGEQRVVRAMGTGIKEMPQSEKCNYLTTKRSILALTDIEEGELFTEQNTDLLRSEKNLRPGLKPEFHHLIIGKPSKRLVGAGYGITWDDVI
jgi:N-acetylneuraminate synthase